MKRLIIFYLSLFALCPSFSQDKEPFEISFGAIKTELKNAASNIGIKYLKSLDDLFENKNFIYTGEKSLLTFTPDLDIKTGSDDAFSSITLKGTFLFMTFETTTVGGIEVPNTSELFHTFPMSIGVETNNNFSLLNTIAEFGWVPWYQAPSREIADWLKNTKIGFFIQTGYKFDLDGSNQLLLGGEADESGELVDSGILRLKGNSRFEIQKLFSIGNYKLGLIGDTTLWYDIANSEIYYRLNGKFRLHISEDKYFDFQYEKGSGAPNFNQGDQYGIGLTVAF